jgi:hypothetical protein
MQQQEKINCTQLKQHMVSLIVFVGYRQDHHVQSMILIRNGMPGKHSSSGGMMNIGKTKLARLML